MQSSPKFLKSGHSTSSLMTLLLLFTIEVLKHCIESVTTSRRNLQGGNCGVKLKQHGPDTAKDKKVLCKISAPNVCEAKSSGIL
jgi:hypothetical protein